MSYVLVSIIASSLVIIVSLLVLLKKLSKKKFIFSIISIPLLAFAYFNVAKNLVLTTYTNDQYGFSFAYPKDWQLDENESSFLDIHVSNMQSGDSPKCTAGFKGIEIQIGLKYSGPNFKTFVESQVRPQGIGLYPSGKISEILIDGRKAYKIENSGWDSGCRGPGYFVQETSTKYTRVFTGSDTGSVDWDSLVKSFNFAD